MTRVQKRGQKADQGDVLQGEHVLHDPATEKARASLADLRSRRAESESALFRLNNRAAAAKHERDRAIGAGDSKSAEKLRAEVETLRREAADLRDAVLPALAAREAELVREAGILAVGAMERMATALQEQFQEITAQTERHHEHAARYTTLARKLVACANDLAGLNDTPGVPETRGLRARWGGLAHMPIRDLLRRTTGAAYADAMPVVTMPEGWAEYLQLAGALAIPETRTPNLVHLHDGPEAA